MNDDIVVSNENFVDTIKRIRPSLNKYNIYLYDNNNNKLKFTQQSKTRIIQNFNYSKLFNDLYNARKQIEAKPLKGGYRQYNKNMQLQAIDRLHKNIEALYKNHSTKLTQEGINQNINSIDLDDYHDNIYKLFKNKIIKKAKSNKRFNNIKSFNLVNIMPEHVLLGQINKNSITPLLIHERNKYQSYKYNIVIAYTTIDKVGNISNHIYESDPVLVRPSQSANELYGNFVAMMTHIKEDLTKRLISSDIRLQSFNKVYLNIVNIDNLTGSSYIKYEGKYKRCIINPQNENNNKCFYYAVAIGLIKSKVKEKIDHLFRISVIEKYMKELNIKIDDSMIDYPFDYQNNKQLIEFQKVNKVSINIFTENDNEDKVLLYKSDINEKGFIELYLLLIFDKNTDNSHYVFINLTSSFRKKDKHLYYKCKKCNGKIKDVSLEVHYRRCVDPNYIKLDKRDTELSKQRLNQRLEDEEYNKMYSNYVRYNEDELEEMDKKLICDYCQNKFNNVDEYNYHNELGCPCKDDPREVIFSPDKYLRFNKYESLGMLNTFIVADFESVLKPVNKNKTDSLELVNVQIPYMYCLKIVSKYIPEKLFIYVGKSAKDTMRHFYKDIYGISFYYNKYVKTHQKEMIDTDYWNEQYNIVNKCYLCGHELTEDNGEYQKVKDHDHITGEILGIACKRCNFKRTEKQTYIPLIFHNAKGYDNHHIVKYFDLADNNLINQVLTINELDDLDNIDLDEVLMTDNNYRGVIKQTINVNIEKALSLTLGVQDSIKDDINGYYIKKNKNFTDIRIIDSAQFFLKPLEKLVDILKKDGNDKFKYMNDYFKDKTNIILQKNLMSYTYFNNYNKYNNDIKELYNKDLYDNYSEDKYKIMLDVVDKFNIKSAGEYYYNYLICDVLELVDIIVNARDKFKKSHGLDILQFYGAPSYTWNCFLFDSKIELEQILDINKLSFFKDMIRGGPSFISKRYSKANNIYCEDYDETKPYIYIDYLDMNNLYGGAMKQPLPFGEIYKISDRRIDLYNKNNNLIWAHFPNYEIDPTAKNINPNTIYKGCCLDVDLEIPKELHRLFNDYPLAPERFEITEDILSPYTKDLLQRMNKKHTKQILLTQTLYNKYHYKIYYKTLRLYVDLGVKILKIHSGYEFKERAYMYDYIMKNTNLRNEAKINKDELGIELYKLMNNSVYGKTLENVFNYKDYKYVNDDNLLKYTSKPIYKSATIINKNSILVENKGIKVKINKPIYVGAIITDIAKYLMFNFHYNYLIPEFGLDNVKLLFTDTDSLAYELTTKNEEERVMHYQNLINKGVLDTSTYSKENKLYNKDHNIIGVMKCEEGDNVITEFAGLRSKMYALKIIKNGLLQEEKKCKGVPQKSLKEINFDKYKSLIFNEESNVLSYSAEVKNIRSYDQQIFDQKLVKCALSCDDTKRYIIDNINTLPYGSCLI